MNQVLCWELLSRILKMAIDVEEFVFEMKCTFEMEREGPRRKNPHCQRMSGIEFGKKGVRIRAALNGEATAIVFRRQRIARE